MRIFFGICIVSVVGMVIVGNLLLRSAANDSASLRRELKACQDQKTIKGVEIRLLSPDKPDETIIIKGDGSLEISALAVAHIKYLYEEDFDEDLNLRN